MSKMPKDVGDVAINKLITYLNNIISNFGPEFEKYEVYIHRYGGDEIHLYLRTKDQFPYSPLELEAVYNQLKKVISNNQFNPQDLGKTEYTLDIENHVWVEPKDKITVIQHLAIRFEDVYVPTNDRLNQLIWQLSALNGLFLSEKETEKQRKLILDRQDPRIVLAGIRPEVQGLGNFLRNIFPGINQAEQMAIKQKLAIKDLEAKLFQQEQKFQPFAINSDEAGGFISKKIKEFISEYPFLQPIFDECVEFDKLVFGVDNNGNLRDSIITKRLISGIIRTGLDPLLGTIDFPKALIEIVRKNSKSFLIVESETSFKPYNDSNHTAGDEIIKQAAIKLLKAVFPENEITGSTPAEYIPHKFSKFILFHRDGTKLFLELLEPKKMNTEELQIFNELKAVFKNANGLNIIEVNDNDEVAGITNVLSTFSPQPDIAEAQKLLSTYGLLSKRAGRDGTIIVAELHKRFADLNYYLAVVDKLLEINLPELQTILENMINREIQENEQSVFTSATQKLAIDTWSDKKRGQNYCSNYIKIINTKITQNLESIHQSSFKHNIISQLEIENEKLRLLKRFFMEVDYNVFKKRIVDEQGEIKEKIINRYRPLATRRHRRGN